MNNELKLKLDEVFKQYSKIPKLGKFKRNKGKMSFERKYEKLKNELLKESEKFGSNDNLEVLKYIDNLVIEYKDLCTSE